MPGFDGLARFVSFCEKKFYDRFRWLLRKKQAKGYGVHSPFAFDLITNAIRSPYDFYAFFDIPEILFQNGLDPCLIGGFNHLSFRLAHYLHPKKILEINSGTGINSLFLMAPSSYIRCRCVEYEDEKVSVAKRLQRGIGRESEITSSLSACEGEGYDAIFIHLDEKLIPDMQTLIELSHADTFWVFHPIKKGTAKQFWNEIVHDVRARVTFDLKDTGIVFLRPDLAKEDYLV